MYTWCRILSVNNHSLISAWFPLTYSDQCWMFVSEGVQNCRPISTLWSTTCFLKHQQSLYRWSIARGPGKQGLKKEFCRQGIILALRSLRMHTVCGVGVPAVESSCIFAHMHAQATQVA